MPSRAALLDDIGRRLDTGQGFTVATLNLDHVVKLRSQPDFWRAYTGHSHVVADGNPIVWLSRIAGQQVELVPGSDLVLPVCAMAAEKGVPVGLLGSTEETLAQTAARLEDANAGLDVSDRFAPAFGFDPAGQEADALIKRMGAARARIWFLALGAPKQEVFAARAAGRLPQVGFLSVGAGLDFIAGTQNRAPQWVRTLSAEWLWRMGTDPVRLAPRYARCIAVLPGLAGKALEARRAGAAAGATR